MSHFLVLGGELSIGCWNFLGSSDYRVRFEAATFNQLDCYRHLFPRLFPVLPYCDSNIRDRILTSLLAAKNLTKFSGFSVSLGSRTL
jgi:hypothetical protein